MVKLIEFATEMFGEKNINVDRVLWTDLYVIDVKSLTDEERESLSYLMINCTDQSVPLRNFEARFGGGMYGKWMLFELLKYPPRKSYPAILNVYARYKIIDNSRCFKFLGFNCYYWQDNPYPNDWPVLFQERKSGILYKDEAYNMAFKLKPSAFSYGDVNDNGCKEKVKNYYILK